MRKKLILMLRYLVVIMVSLVVFFPFLWMVLSALKTKAEIMNPFVFFPSVPQWKNLVEVAVSSPLPRYIMNSFYVASCTVCYQVISGAMLAYALVFLRFRGRNFLYAVIMATYMVPPATGFIPSYVILAKLHLLDSYTGLIISNAVSIFGVFLLRQAFLQVPRSLVEAARMDGARHLQILWQFLFPYCRGSFITFGFMSFVTCYNNYMWPSLITYNQNLNLVSQGLRSYFIQGAGYGTEWGLVMAGCALIVLPLIVLFFIFNKWFISGLGGDTGVKE